MTITHNMLHEFLSNVRVRGCFYNHVGLGNRSMPDYFYGNTRDFKIRIPALLWYTDCGKVIAYLKHGYDIEIPLDAKELYILGQEKAIRYLTVLSKLS